MGHGLLIPVGDIAIEAGPSCLFIAVTKTTYSQQSLWRPWLQPRSEHMVRLSVSRRDRDRHGEHAHKGGDCSPKLGKPVGVR